MRKEEYEAICAVNDYLLHQAVEMAQKFAQKKISFEEFMFWKNSFCEYSKYYLEVTNQYKNKSK